MTTGGVEFKQMRNRNGQNCSVISPVVLAISSAKLNVMRKFTLTAPVLSVLKHFKRFTMLNHVGY